MALALKPQLQYVADTEPHASGGCQADGGGVSVGMGQKGDPPPRERGPSDLCWNRDDGLPREQRWACLAHTS